MKWNELEKLYFSILDNVFPEINRETLGELKLSEALEFWPARYVKEEKFFIEISKSQLEKMDKYEAIVLVHELSHILVGIGPKTHKILSGFLTTLIDEAVANLVTLVKLPKILKLLKEEEKKEFIRRVIEEFDLHNPAYIISDIDNTKDLLVGYGIRENADKEVQEILERSPLSIIAFLYYLIDRYGDKSFLEKFPWDIFDVDYTIENTQILF